MGEGGGVSLSIRDSDFRGGMGVNPHMRKGGDRHAAS